MGKKVIPIIILLMILGNTSYASDINFSDINNKSYFYKEMVELYNYGVITGYSDGTFRPDKVVTKMEYIKMILDLLGYKERLSPDCYWGSNYIKLAETIGFIEKGEYKQESLNTQANREDIFKLTEKALIFIGDEVTEEEVIKFNELNQDFEEIEISPLFIKGIVNDIFTNIGTRDIGYESRINFITREETSTILVRIINKDSRIKIFKGEE